MKPIAMLAFFGLALALIAVAGQVREFNLTLQATFMSKGKY